MTVRLLPPPSEASRSKLGKVVGVWIAGVVLVTVAALVTIGAVALIAWVARVAL